MKIKGLLFITLATLISCGFFGDKVDKEEISGRYVLFSEYEFTYKERLVKMGAWNLLFYYL
jgi:hypothetical protein